MTGIRLCDRSTRGAGQLIVHEVHPLNAETPREALGRATVTPTELFFVRTHGPIPQVDGRAYRLTVAGEHRMALTLGDLGRFSRATATTTLACAGNRRSDVRPVPAGLPWGIGAIGTATWSGVRLRDVLLAAGLGPRARHVAFTGVDDVDGERFAGSIPLEKALAAEVLLADEMNGRPLTSEHGFPLRVVVPGYVGARSVKWLTSITVQSEPSASSFQRSDYALHGVPLGELPVTSAVCRPGDGPVVGPGVRLEGYAMGAGGRRVVRVEVSTDGGESWFQAVPRGPATPWTWRLWHAVVRLGPGAHELVVRACDASGANQPPEVDATGNPRGYLTNAWHRTTVVVENAG